MCFELYLESILNKKVQNVNHTKGNDWAVVTMVEPIAGRSVKQYFCVTNV